MTMCQPELSAIIAELKNAGSYLECETIIVGELKKLLNAGNAIAGLQGYLERLLPQLKKMYKNTAGEERINYKYAEAYVNTLLTTTFWYSWIKSM